MTCVFVEKRSAVWFGSAVESRFPNWSQRTHRLALVVDVGFDPAFVRVDGRERVVAFFFGVFSIIEFEASPSPALAESGFAARADPRTVDGEKSATAVQLRSLVGMLIEDHVELAAGFEVANGEIKGGLAALFACSCAFFGYPLEI